MKSSCFVKVAVLYLAAATATAAEPVITVTDAWIAEAPPTVNVNAGYMVIINRGNSERVLESVTSPVFMRVEMHRSIIDKDGTAGMRQQESIPIPAGEEFEFKPGGYHLMLFENREPVRSGDNIDLTLRFSDGTLLETSAAVHRMDGHRHH